MILRIISNIKYFLTLQFKDQLVKKRKAIKYQK